MINRLEDEMNDLGERKMYVIKRDGETAAFDRSKIKAAVEKAMKYGSGIYDEDIAAAVARDCEKHFSEKEENPTIYMIEGLVYDRLMHYNHMETARAYEGYRAVQQFKRQVNTTDDSILELMKKANEDVMMENSNKNAVICSTQRDLIAGEVSKDIARRKLIPPHIVQAHDEGSIHWHDMDYTIQPL